MWEIDPPSTKVLTDFIRNKKLFIMDRYGNIQPIRNKEEIETDLKKILGNIQPIPKSRFKMFFNRFFHKSS